MTVRRVLPLFMDADVLDDALMREHAARLIASGYDNESVAAKTGFSVAEVAEIRATTDCEIRPVQPT
jgi:hypothetical protein